MFQCDFCPRSYYNRADLKSHTFESHNDHICHICDKIYKHSGALKTHLDKFHTKEYRVLSDNGDTVVHTMSDTTCHICHKNFSHFKSLRLHVEEFHGQIMDHNNCQFCTRVHHCYHCTKAFKHPRVLHKHIHRSHAKELEEEDKQTVFTCPICNFMASSSAFLRQHRINHKTCQKCAETFPGGKYAGRIWEKHIRIVITIPDLPFNKSIQIPNDL